MQRILFVILLSICLALPSPALAKCSRWSFSLRTFLLGTAALMVGAGYYGNERRRRAAYEEFWKSLNKFPRDENDNSEAWRQFASRGFATSSITSPPAIKSLKRIIETDPVLQERTTKLRIDWDWLLKRAQRMEAANAKDQEEGLKNPGNKIVMEQLRLRSLERHYDAWDETKALEPIFRAVFEREAEKGTPRMHIADELERHHGLENGRELFRRRQEPPWYTDTYAAAWCEHNKIPIEQFIEVLLGPVPPNEIARYKSDFRPGRYSYSTLVDDAIKRKQRELQLSTGRQIRLDETLDALKAQILAQYPPK